MPDSQSSEPGFESPFATVSKIGHFRSLHCGPSWLSCINEYLAIDSGGHVGDLVLARNCCLTRMLPGEAELVSEWTGLPGKAKSVKRFERSNGLDTALYKNYLYLLAKKLSMSLCQTKWLPCLSPRNVSSWDQRIALTLTSSTRESWDWWVQGTLISETCFIMS